MSWAPHVNNPNCNTFRWACRSSPQDSLGERVAVHENDLEKVLKEVEAAAQKAALLARAIARAWRPPTHWRSIRPSVVPRVPPWGQEPWPK